MRVITGCPRSGTSFVCQIANRLGANFGDSTELIGANCWNRNGYFENRQINTINHRLMFGRWSDPGLWIDSIWEDNLWSYIQKTASLCCSPFVCREKLIRRRAACMREQLKRVAVRLEKTTVKDPRFCHTLCGWQTTGAIESVLFVIRHPSEVARSLKRQTGYPTRLTYKAWTDSIERFLMIVDEFDVHWVDFNILSSQRWRQELTPITHFLDLEMPQEDEVESVYKPELQNCRSNGIKIPKGIQQLYEQLLDRKASRAYDKSDSSTAF